MAIKRLYVEKKPGANAHAKKVAEDIASTLRIKAEDLRVFIRYDIEGLEGDDLANATGAIFSEPPVDNVFNSLPDLKGYKTFAVEYLPGQYDQRADSAAQCVQLLTCGAKPLIRCATVYAVKGINDEQFEAVIKFLINPVEARRASEQLPLSLIANYGAPAPVSLVLGFIDWDEEAIKNYHKEMGFAFSIADLLFIQAHFASLMRNPTITELKVIDTYWSDHCRHTTFLTQIENLKIKSDNPHIEETYAEYCNLFNSHYAGRVDKYPNFMDIATIGARELKRQNKIPNLDLSEEINACSIKVTVDVDGKPEEYLVMFKNETHNHPTEIEPFGGAATCLGGAIRDPLSGRVYVYQAMRITGAGDITAPFEKTLKGKLPQRVISKTAAAGFSSYGNQIGLATGMVKEIFYDGYQAKRLETGFVVGAAPAKNVIRAVPIPGDLVILIGGETGRDGCGGATGSSKAHTIDSIETCGAEVQKGNPLTERKIQRLFTNNAVTTLIKRCNDFGAGGVSVAIGELSDGLDINLDAVPKKYMGLNSTEIAISESQERMAVVVDKADAEKMISLAREENLDATIVATVTDTKSMRMFSGGNMIVDLSRKFLDSNGARQKASVVIKEDAPKFFNILPKEVDKLIDKGEYAEAAKILLSSLNVCSQKGLTEMFDSSVGAGSVLMPLGGKNQLTPSMSIAAKIPVQNGTTDTTTVAAYGFDPKLMSESPYVGAIYSVITSVLKVVATGVSMDTIRLTFQEYFLRLGSDPERWGKPLSALLGALSAQLRLGLGAIGGKDSMSGSFEKIDVPPTLISFALGITKGDDVITNTLTQPNEKLYRIKLKKDKYSVPDFEYFTEFAKLLYGAIARREVKFANIVEEGGLISAVIKSCLGSGLGAEFFNVKRDYFTSNLGDIVLTVTDKDVFLGYDIECIGQTKQSGKFVFSECSDEDNCVSTSCPNEDELSFTGAVAAFSGTLNGVYPVSKSCEGAAETLNFNAKNVVFWKKKKVSPKIFIPVFPGTNCEYDTAKRFTIAGGEPVVYVIKNKTREDIDKSCFDIEKLVKDCQILAFAGGFSGGDEPDGSGKFIATTFRNNAIAAATDNLLNKRGGLVLGICNGFQALIKLGLLPLGKIAPLTENSPTLTFNNISRHVSTVSEIRVSSNLSPWLKYANVGEVYSVAISHGEGKFIASDEDIKALIKNGQIATQYVDFTGKATMESPFNPNGSYMAIEGITSLDGRVYGKMGHSERIGKNIMKNIEGKTDMKIFEAGVEYFK